MTTTSRRHLRKAENLLASIVRHGPEHYPQVMQVLREYYKINLPSGFTIYPPQGLSPLEFAQWRTVELTFHHNRELIDQLDETAQVALLAYFGLSPGHEGIQRTSSWLGKHREMTRQAYSTALTRALEQLKTMNHR